MTAHDKLNELLEQWEELRAAGQTLSACELAEHLPELIPELERRILALLRMEELLDLELEGL